MNKHQIMFLIFIIIFNIIFLSCKKPTEPSSKANLMLKLEDVSCTEAWIKLTTADIQLPTSVILKQNEITRATINLTTADTLIYIDSLLPKRTYIFQATSSQSSVSSNKANVTTMDTTSHNFTFETFTFGEHSSSALLDVAIINENNIWAVGRIYMNDSLGNYDPNAYNAVHWNGSEWKLKKIGGQGGWTCRSVFAFSENDVWFEGMIKWDGEKYTVHKNGWPLLPNGDGWQVNKMWGTSSKDLYAVGNGGNIAHWDGVRWRKINSGTDIDLRDISGTTDGKEIYISGYSIDYSRSILLKLVNNSVRTIWENNTLSGIPPYGHVIYSLFLTNKNLFISSNYGVFKDKLNINFPTRYLMKPPRRVYKITGTNINDIYTAGDDSNIWHYNGVSKKELYINYYNPLTPFYSANAKGNIFAAVGTEVINVVYFKATITILKRM